MLDFIISFELHLHLLELYLLTFACYITGILSRIYTFFMRNRFISHYINPRKVK